MLDLSMKNMKVGHVGFLHLPLRFYKVSLMGQLKAAIDLLASKSKRIMSIQPIRIKKMLQKNFKSVSTLLR